MSKEYDEAPYEEVIYPISGAALQCRSKIKSGWVNQQSPTRLTVGYATGKRYKLINKGTDQRTGFNISDFEEVLP